MPFLNFKTKNRVKIWDGINGALFHSDKLTVGHMIIDDGTLLPEHSHPHEQWLNLLEGELELTVGGETQVVYPGMTVYIPSNIPHSGKALTACKAIDVFFPGKGRLCCIGSEIIASVSMYTPGVYSQKFS